MDPNRPTPYQNGTPPPTPAPQPEAFAPYGSAYQQPPQHPPAYPQQPPYQDPMAHHASIGTAAAPHPQPSAPTQTQASWYTPAPQPVAAKPNDASSYLQSAGVGTPQAPPSGASGQTINGQYSIDYLNQLAPPSSHGIDKRFIIVGIAGAIAMVVAAFLIFSTPQTTSTKSEVSLYTTMVDLETSTRQSGRLIKSSQLAAISSNMRTTLLNASRDMEEPLTSMGQDPSSLKSAATKPPYHDDAFVTTLEDARLNGIYDRIYANEINTKVRFILAYMDSVEKNNSRDSMKTFIGSNKPSFETIQKSIEEYRASPDANL